MNFKESVYIDGFVKLVTYNVIHCFSLPVIILGIIPHTWNDEGYFNWSLAKQDIASWIIAIGSLLNMVV